MGPYVVDVVAGDHVELLKGNDRFLFASQKGRLVDVEGFMQFYVVDGGVCTGNPG